jgi:hydroxyacylglutathione hydrolase
MSSTARSGVEVVSIDTPALGDRSYLAHDGKVALVVDPQRDIDRVLDLATSRGVRITHVFETHLHNDYVTGGLALARATGADYHVNGADQVAFDRVPAGDGDLIEVSPLMRVRVLATPGHTFTHLSYALEAAGQVRAVFTGGSLLYGSTGRPDLLGRAHADELARAQFASAHRLAAELPDDAGVYPTHGFGSFCSATQSEGGSSTLGRERLVNPVLTLAEDRYVSELLAGLDAFPAYYAHMGPANAAGPSGPDLTPPRRADAGELRRRIGAGEWVVDLRARRAFAAGHAPGTLSFDLDGSFATYLGWLIPWGTPLTLLGQSPAEIAAAQRDLARIGIDQVLAAADGGPDAWSGGQPLSRYLVTDFAGYTQALGHREFTLLDVRSRSEWQGARIATAVHIPLQDLPSRIGEIAPGEIWVHCQSGYRASVAAGLLDAAGRDVVLIDDDFSTAEAAGLANPGAVPAH